MSLKAIILHLRLPFSLFLMPVYWFAVSQVPDLDSKKAIGVFIILHLFIYPASNAYNSYFDKDEGSIGGLEKPPTVDKKLYWSATLLDALGVLSGIIFIDFPFGIMCLVYILVSRMYSYDGIRLKKHAVLSWLIVGLFQGSFTYLTVYRGVSSTPQHWGGLLEDALLPMLIAACILWAIYPMTQIYQHEEDARRGDITLSMRLGLRGSFYFSAFFYSLAFILFFLYLPIEAFKALLLINLPTVTYFGWWFLRVYKNPAQADFKNTMRLNGLASLCMNVFYIYLLINK